MKVELRKVNYDPATEGFNAQVAVNGNICLQVSRAAPGAKLEVNVQGCKEAARFKDMLVKDCTTKKTRVRDVVEDLFQKWYQVEITAEIQKLCKRYTLYRTYRHTSLDKYEIMAVRYNQETVTYLHDTFGELLVEIVNDRFLEPEQRFTAVAEELQTVEDDF